MCKYVAFDVETPNSYCNRISAIGITVIENEKITNGYYSIVNPKQHFDRFNVDLTGINEKLANGYPDFPKIWNEIEPLMSSGILLAHNAPFDLGVIKRCLEAYNIPWKKEVNYVCTCRMARKILPYIENHRLNTLCDFFGIALNHHNAESDSSACAEIFLTLLKNGAKPNDYIKTYDMKNGKTLKMKAKDVQL